MATGKEWQDHFDKVSPETLSDLRDALDTLAMDDMMLKEFKDTGLFTLKHFIVESLEKKPQETNKIACNGASRCGHADGCYHAKPHDEMPVCSDNPNAPDHCMNSWCE